MVFPLEGDRTGNCPIYKRRLRIAGDALNCFSRLLGISLGVLGGHLTESLNLRGTCFGRLCESLDLVEQLCGVLQVLPRGLSARLSLLFNCVKSAERKKPGKSNHDAEESQDKGDHAKPSINIFRALVQLLTPYLVKAPLYFDVQSLQ